MGSFSYSDYLLAKLSIDDRALNRHVLNVLRRELKAAKHQTVKVLEVGAGIGTMVSRLADWDVMTRAEYTLLDGDISVLGTVHEHLSSWATSTGRRVRIDGRLLWIDGGAPEVHLTVQCAHRELHDFLVDTGNSSCFDLVIATAFLDLVDVPATLPPLLATLKPAGLYWFTINFDGETIFVPEHPLDEQLMRLYHLSMDTRIRGGRRAGDSRTGRHLFEELATAGADVLAAGSSDWVVHAIGGVYPASEAAFLENIVQTIEDELRSWAEVDRGGLEAWLTTRREQLARAQLVYVAHQLDFAGRSRSASPG